MMREKLLHLIETTVDLHAAQLYSCICGVQRRGGAWRTTIHMAEDHQNHVTKHEPKLPKDIVLEHQACPRKKRTIPDWRMSQSVENQPPRAALRKLDPSPV
eukprot:c20726_g6_i2.p1 GENE.c20726_g6_i2~~c20726_g6_i2.p1  ORF type:complete len:101 (-),score=4.57 c20726_g6_i2:197-499(-)